MIADWTWHGGGLAAAKRHFGTDGLPWLDLSTGISPYPWPGAEGMNIDWRRLPEPDALAALEEAAASCFGIDARHVCAVPGSETGLRLVGRLIGGPACHVTPAYRTHGAMIAGADAIGRADASHRADTLILANPNNPDGHIIDPAMLETWLDARRAASWLLVDEAFADCLPRFSVAARVGDDERLIVFRSFGKFFGLAGVRLGFVLGPRPLLAELRHLLGAWPVSAAAVTIGTAAYRDGPWIEATRTRLREDAVKLDAALRRAGHAPRGDCPLFRLIETTDAHALFNRLARAAILTRPFAERSDRLRIGLPADARALARLEAALADG